MKLHWPLFPLIASALLASSAMAEEGVPQRFAPVLPGLDSSRTVLSLRADLLPGTSIVYEHAGMLRSAQPLLAGLPTQHTTRMGVEFRPASLKNAVPLGALRMQLSGNSTLLLRPRSGGLSVNWRSQF